jgi:hypothetical protein
LGTGEDDVILFAWNCLTEEVKFDSKYRGIIKYHGFTDNKRVSDKKSWIGRLRILSKNAKQEGNSQFHKKTKTETFVSPLSIKVQL